MKPAALQFPLSLNIVEDYLLSSDNLRHPMHIVIKLRFTGQLNQPIFEQSLAATISRHPLLSAKVDFSRKGLRWIDGQKSPNIEWDATFDSGELPEMEPFDLREHSGLKFWRVARNFGDELVILAHHCMTDAIGLCQFTEELLLDYAHRIEGNEGAPTIPEPSFSRFAERHTPGTSFLRFGGKLHRYPARFKKSVVMNWSPVARMTNPNQTSPCESLRTFKYRRLEFDQTETAQIVATSKRQGATVNSLLMRDTFQAFHDEGAFADNAPRTFDVHWGTNGSKPPCLRIRLPIDLRRWGAGGASICNAFGMHSVECRPEQLEAPAELLNSLHQCVTNTVNGEDRYLFAAGLRMQQWVKAASFGMSGPHPLFGDLQSNCLFSNLGVLFRDLDLPKRNGKFVVGDVELESWDFIPPVISGSDLAIGVYTYADRLTMLLHYSEEDISTEQVERLHSTLTSRILASSGLSRLSKAV